MSPLIMLLIQQLPGLLQSVKDTFGATHPTEPVPTDEEILQAFEQAFQSSRAKDDAWLSAHPVVN